MFKGIYLEPSRCVLSTNLAICLLCVPMDKFNIPTPQYSASADLKCWLPSGTLQVLDPHKNIWFTSPSPSDRKKSHRGLLHHGGTGNCVVSGSQLSSHHPMCCSASWEKVRSSCGSWIFLSLKSVFKESRNENLSCDRFLLKLNNKSQNLQGLHAN